MLHTREPHMYCSVILIMHNSHDFLLPYRHTPIPEKHESNAQYNLPWLYHYSNVIPKTLSTRCIRLIVHSSQSVLLYFILYCFVCKWFLLETYNSIKLIKWRIKNDSMMNKMNITRINTLNLINEKNAP